MWVAGFWRFILYHFRYCGCASMCYLLVCGLTHVGAVAFFTMMVRLAVAGMYSALLFTMVAYTYFRGL